MIDELCPAETPRESDSDAPSESPPPLWAAPNNRILGPARDDFPELLRGFRERLGCSRNGLARQVGVDPSYLTRIEHGDREPPRQYIVEAICRTLKLSPLERNRLLTAAGYAPLVVGLPMVWDDCLQAVSDVLNDGLLSEQERGEYRSMILSISKRWKGAED